MMRLMKKLTLMMIIKTMMQKKKKRGKTSPATILSGANSALASGRLNLD